MISIFRLLDLKTLVFFVAIALFTALISGIAASFVSGVVKPPLMH